MPENQPPSGTPPASQPAAPAPDQKEKEARTWNMWCHMSALAGLVIPSVGSILGPLLVWQMKKNEFPSVDVHGKASMKFQITVGIAVLILMAVDFPLTAVCIGFVFIVAAMVVGIAGLVFAIIAGITANEGQEYKYPWTLTLIKELRRKR